MVLAVSYLRLKFEILHSFKNKSDRSRASLTKRAGNLTDKNLMNPIYLI